jgi:hypothetical protein
VTERKKWKDLVRQAKAQWAVVPVEEEEETRYCKFISLHLHNSADFITRVS